MTAPAPDHADLTARDLRRLDDPAAFRRLYEAHAGFVQYVASRAGARGGEADDVVQETFMRLMQHGRAIEDPAKLRAWLATTARRVTIDLARKRKREKEDDVALENASSAEYDDEREREHEREQDIAMVRELVEEVSKEPGGETFKMFYVDGLSARVIAEAKGEAVSTVTTRLSRFRERFREKFKRRLSELATGKRA